MDLKALARQTAGVGVAVGSDDPVEEVGNHIEVPEPEPPPAPAELTPALTPEEVLANIRKDIPRPDNFSEVALWTASKWVEKGDADREVIGEDDLPDPEWVVLLRDHLRSEEEIVARLMSHPEDAIRSLRALVRECADVVRWKVAPIRKKDSDDVNRLMNKLRNWGV